MKTKQVTKTPEVNSAKLGMKKTAASKNSKAKMPVINQRMRVQNRIRSTFTGTRLFDRSLHKTNTWLKEIMDLMNWNNRERALSALRATLHALRDVLPLQENIHLSAQLPIMIRGLYFENWHYHPEPLRLKGIGEFYELVREKLGQGLGRFTTDEIRQFTRCCLFVLTDHVSAGEIYDIKGILRRNLKELISVSFDELQSSRKYESLTRREKQNRDQDPNRVTTRKSKKDLNHAKQARQHRIESHPGHRNGNLH